MEDKLGDVLVDLLRSDMATAWSDESRRIAEQARARQAERENERARAAYEEYAVGKRFKQDAVLWEESQRLRSYLAAMRERVATIVDEAERFEAGVWIAGYERYTAESVDPLRGPLVKPEVTEPSSKDVSAFRQRLGFGY